MVFCEDPASLTTLHNSSTYDFISEKHIFQNFHKYLNFR